MMKTKKTKTKAEKIIKELDPQIKSLLEAIGEDVDSGEIATKDTLNRLVNEAKKDGTPSIIFETDTKIAMICLRVHQKSTGRYCEEISKTLVDVLEIMMELIGDKERALSFLLSGAEPELKDHRHFQNLVTILINSKHGEDEDEDETYELMVKRSFIAMKINPKTMVNLPSDIDKSSTQH